VCQAVYSCHVSIVLAESHNYSHRKYGPSPSPSPYSVRITAPSSAEKSCCVPGWWVHSRRVSKPAGQYRYMRSHARQSTRTQGRGTITSATQPNSVFPHLYVNAANICCVNNGKAMPSRLPQKIALGFYVVIRCNLDLKSTYEISSAPLWPMTHMFHNYALS
jgi:hypothetical protein